jgi:hypothetical protein
MKSSLDSLLNVIILTAKDGTTVYDPILLDPTPCRHDILFRHLAVLIRGTLTGILSHFGNSALCVGVGSAMGGIRTDRIWR